MTFGYPGYQGVFYDANCLSMCCIVMATSALLLAYASFTQGHRKAALAYFLLGVLAAFTLLLTLSRSGLLAFVGVVVILTGAIIAGTAKHPGAPAGAAGGVHRAGGHRGRAHHDG